MEMNIFLVVSMFVLLFLGAPIFVALCLPTVLSLILFTPNDIMVVAMNMFSGIDKFSLLSVPFFVLAANIMKNGGIGQRIVSWAAAMVGDATGGLAFTTEVASMSLKESVEVASMAAESSRFPSLLLYRNM